MENITNNFIEEEKEIDLDKLMKKGVITEETLDSLSNGKGTEEDNEKYYKKSGQMQLTKAASSYTNSPLVSYTCISPNHNSPRNHAIDTITIHMVVGQCTVETLGSIFKPTSRQASSNYGVGTDGRIGMYVFECDRSWCSSSAVNDNRAITIETASDTFYPYKVNDKAYNALIKLCADICKRNGKTKMVWCGTLGRTNARSFAPNEMRMTLHRWFASTSCPGFFLESHMQDIADKVNKLLVEEEKSVFNDIPTTDEHYQQYKKIWELGIMKADKKGNFNPKKKITRGSLAVILYRVLKKANVIK